MVLTALYRSSLTFVCLSVSAAGLAEPTTLQTTETSGIIGSAYRSDKESFVGSECVTGVIVPSGKTESTFNLTQTLSERDASRMLDLAAGARARFGAVKVSASTSFVKISVSSDMSTSAVWLSEYNLPRQRLTLPLLSKVGKDVQANHERWDKTCGDRFVNEIRYGARLFFSIRIDFRSKEQKEAFEAKFSIKGPLASANATLSQATREFARDTKVVVSGLQQGGDVSKITGLFPSTVEGRAGFVSCTLGDFEKCSSLIGHFLYYATDLQTGFPSQLSSPGPGGSPLELSTVPYSAIGEYSPVFPGLTEAIAQARAKLHTLFEDNFRLSIISDRLLETELDGSSRSRILTERAKLNFNLDQILLASEVCYETPTSCKTKVDRLVIKAIDRASFDLPPAPLASYRIWSSGAAVWTRKRSIQQLSVCKRHPSPHPATHEDTWWFSRTMHDLAEENGTVGVGLLVEGIGLREAKLFFEGKEVATYPLLKTSDSHPDKRGTDWAFLVLASTRVNPGWIDINLSDHRKKLISEGMSAADGVFYLIVSDAFGRSSRFDIEYQNWNGEYLVTQNRWWDPNSGGISVAGEGNWSLDVTGETTLFTRIRDESRREACDRRAG